MSTLSGINVITLQEYPITPLFNFPYQGVYEIMKNNFQ